MKPRYRKTLPLLSIIALCACEDVSTTKVKTYRELQRNSSQIRQDRLYSVIMSTASINKGSGDSGSDSQANVVGSLGLGEGYMPETALPALITALDRSETGDTVTQREIINALGNTRSDLAIPVLVYHLNKTAGVTPEDNADPNQTAVLNAPVRAEACIALAQIGSKAAIKPLIDVLLDSELSVRQAAKTALNQITNQEKGFTIDADFEGRVISQSSWITWWNENREQSRDEWLRTGFTEKNIDIADFGSIDSLVALVGALEKGEPFIRNNAADLIHRMQFNDAELKAATGKLIALLDHDLEGVRRSALVTVIRINSLSSYIKNEDGTLSLDKAIQYLPTSDLDPNDLTKPSATPRMPQAIARVKKWWNNGSKSGGAEKDGGEEE